jgi:hypothetical protein
MVEQSQKTLIIGGEVLWSRLPRCNVQITRLFAAYRFQDRTACPRPSLWCQTASLWRQTQDAPISVSKMTSHAKRREESLYLRLRRIPRQRPFPPLRQWQRPRRQQRRRRRQRWRQRPRRQRPRRRRQRRQARPLGAVLKEPRHRRAERKVVVNRRGGREQGGGGEEEVMKDEDDDHIGNSGQPVEHSSHSSDDPLRLTVPFTFLGALLIQNADDPVRIRISKDVLQSSNGLLHPR